MLLIPFELDPNQHRLAAILAFVVVWWVTEAIPIPVTAVLGVALVALLEATPPPPEGDSATDVVFAAFSDDTFFLFIGSFIIAQSMVVHGLHRRLAYRVLSSRYVGGSTYRIILAFGLIGAVTSPVMSNTAGAAMMLPLALGVMGVVGGMVANQLEGDRDPERLRFGSALMLVITYGITVGGLLLPIGSPPNLIGRELLQEETGEPITFLEWFLMALPIVVVMFIAVVLVVTLMNRPEVRQVEGVEEYVADERRKLGPLSRGEKNTLLVLAFALIGWFLPGLVGVVAGDDSDAYTQVSEAANEGTVAIIAAALLFVLPLDWARRKFTLNWNEAARIDWGTILLFGGGIVLGTMLSETGLAEELGKWISDTTGVLDDARDHGRDRGRRDPDLGDHQQHRERGDHGADRDLDRRRVRREPDHPGARRDLRGKLRVHAAGLDATERDRLLLRARPDHADVEGGSRLRRDRRDSLRRRRDRDGEPGGAGVALARPLAIAVAAGAASVLPGFLVGALALQIRGDLDVRVEEVAAGVSVFFLAGAIGASAGGRLADRIGAGAALRALHARDGARACSARLCSPSSLAALFVFLAVAGVSNAVAQPATNLFVAEEVPADRQGLGFGIKQSGIPGAIVVSGLALPVLAIPFGWRPTFAICALAPLAVAVVLRPGRVARPTPRPRAGRPSRALVLTALGAALATGGPCALGAYLVASAVDVGVAGGRGRPAGRARQRAQPRREDLARRARRPPARVRARDGRAPAAGGRGRVRADGRGLARAVRGRRADRVRARLGLAGPVQPGGRGQQPRDAGQRERGQPDRDLRRRGGRPGVLRSAPVASSATAPRGSSSRLCTVVAAGVMWLAARAGRRGCDTFSGV